MRPHPRLRTRDLRLPALRVLVYAPDSPREEWIVDELSGVDALTQVGRSLESVIAALVEDPPPRPAVLVVDFDRMAPAEVLQLHQIRDLGWCGVIVGIGMVPIPLRLSLGVEHLVDLPAAEGTIRAAIEKVGFQSQTVRIPVRRDPAPPVVFQVRTQPARVITKR